MTHQEARLAVEPAPAFEGLSRENRPDVDSGWDVAGGDASGGDAGRGDRGSSAWPIALAALLALLLAILSFAAGIVAEREWFADRAAESDGPTIGEIEALLAAESYYWPDDPSEQEAVRGALEQGALAAAAAVLHRSDPYTVYLPPDQAQAAADDLEGEYGGIGVYIEVVAGALTVVAPMAGSPAEEVGLQTGDVLLAADGQSLSGLTPEQAGLLVRGPEGTTVRLQVQRPGTPEPFELDVVRRKIDTPVVEYGFDGETGVAVVKVSIFNDKTTAQLDEALARAQADGAVAIVLDLRSNGGGWVSAAQEMVGRFVPEDRGPALYEDDDRAEGNELRAEPIEGGGPRVFDLPLVVLVNGGTASAAEIVAGALRDYERATIAGEPTFGKGSVQRVHDFGDGSSLRITFAIWLTPGQQPIDGVGIAPQVAIDPPAETITGADPDLQEAIGGDSQLRAAIAIAAGGGPAGITVAGTPSATPQA